MFGIYLSNVDINNYHTFVNLNQTSITRKITFYIGPECHYCYSMFPFSMTYGIFEKNTKTASSMEISHLNSMTLPGFHECMNHGYYKKQNKKKTLEHNKAKMHTCTAIIISAQ